MLKKSPKASYPYFSRNIRNLRQEHGFTQQALAERLGIDRSTYTYWEIGRTEPSLAIIDELCEIYDIDFNEILKKD